MSSNLPAVAVQLPGGALRGANVVTTLEALTGVGVGARQFPKYAVEWERLRFAGNSIGALLALAASDGPEGVAQVRPLFAGLQSIWDILSVPFDLKDGLLRDGIVSMKRAMKLLRDNKIGAVCKYPAWVGITIARTGEYEEVCLNDLPYPERLEATFVSASQSPAMEIVRWLGQVAYDSGLESAVCPPIPHAVLAEWGTRTGEWHELWPAPPDPAARRAPRTESEVDDALGLLGAQLDRQVARVCEADLERSRQYATRGHRGFRYAPSSMAAAGPTFGPLDPVAFRKRIHGALTTVGSAVARSRATIAP